jgi:integrase
MAVRTPNTIRSRFDHVWAVIRAAVADRAIPFDISLGHTPPPPYSRGSHDDPDYSSGGAIQHASEQFTAFVAIRAFLRLGAAGGLRVSDIDFMRRQVHVQRQVQVVTGGGVDIRPPKYGRERTVYVPDGVLQMRSEHVRLHVPGEDPDRWMFADSRGAPSSISPSRSCAITPIAHMLNEALTADRVRTQTQ